jgi:A/G-specific adenine glycosylase
MDLTQALLDWYDRHARRLPWRLPPGSPDRPDPYRVWLAEVMLQQTTVAAVSPRYARFLARWPSVEALAAAPEAEVMAEWAGLGYYARARNLIACARAVAERGGFPQTEAELRALPGLGAYTAASVAAIAFGEPAAVVDGNVERVIARAFDIATPLPQARKAIRERVAALTPAHRPGDFAQGMMDLGATVCTPRRPACVLCPWAGACLARRAGTELQRPVKPPRKAPPERSGVAYVGRRADGAWLLETRDPDGMLGGMPGFPGSAWDRGEADAPPPAPGDWQEMDRTARHGFTHFTLILRVRVARLPPGTNPGRGAFVPALDPATLPTAMRRVLEIALASPLIADP